MHVRVYSFERPGERVSKERSIWVKESRSGRRWTSPHSATVRLSPVRRYRQRRSRWSPERCQATSTSLHRRRGAPSLRSSRCPGANSVHDGGAERNLVRDPSPADRSARVGRRLQSRSRHRVLGDWHSQHHQCSVASRRRSHRLGVVGGHERYSTGHRPTTSDTTCRRPGRRTTRSQPGLQDTEQAESTRDDDGPLGTT